MLSSPLLLMALLRAPPVVFSEPQDFVLPHDGPSTSRSTPLSRSPIHRTLGSLPNHKGVFQPPPNQSRLLCRPLKAHQGPQGAPNHTKVI